MLIFGKKSKHQPSKKKIKAVQLIYIIATILWILIIYCLRVHKYISAIATLILAFPIFVFAMGFLHAYIDPNEKNKSFGVDFFALGIIFLGIIFKVSHLDQQHYTVAIMIVALILLILSATPVPSSKGSKLIVNNVQLILQTAAITLFVYVLYVIVACKVPLGGKQSGTESKGLQGGLI